MVTCFYKRRTYRLSSLLANTLEDDVHERRNDTDAVRTLGSSTLSPSSYDDVFGSTDLRETLPHFRISLINSHAKLFSVYETK
jgi:hypothetical protein